VSEEGVPFASNAISNQRLWRVVPYVVIRMSVDYNLCYFLRACHLSFLKSANIKVGYESCTYLNGLSRIDQINSNQIGVSFDEYRNVSMHGFFTGIDLNF
jgi:hypothetical protein